MNTLINSIALSAAVGEISKQTAAKITDAVKDKAALSLTTQKVDPDQLPVPVVRFNGFYTGGDKPLNASPGVEYNICFHPGAHKFVAVKAGLLVNPDVWSNFPEVLNYQDGPLSHPFPDRLFLDEQSGELYQFEDGDLVKITNFSDYMKSSEYEIMTADDAVAMVQQAFANNEEEQ